MINIMKSYRLSRFHLSVVLCVILLLVGILLRYFDMIQATMEKTTVETNLNDIMRMMHAQNLLSIATDRNCSFLNDPNLFPQASRNVSDETGNQGSNRGWEYNEKNHALTYFVRTRTFFSSRVAQKIIIHLYCKKGRVVFKVSPYKWCHKMSLWGCAVW